MAHVSALVSEFGITTTGRPMAGVYGAEPEAVAVPAAPVAKAPVAAEFNAGALLMVAPVATMAQTARRLTGATLG